MNDTLYAFYDLDIEPITFDFAPFLAQCDANRQLLGLESIFVILVPGKTGGLREELPEYEAVCDVNHRRWRISNILTPLMELLPACRGYMLCQSRDQAREYEQARYVFPEDYSVAFPVYTAFSDWLECHKQGASLRVFEAPPQALDYVRVWLAAHAGSRQIVTITLRHYEFMKDRNSNVEAWAEVAETLEREGYFVVVVPDLEQSLNGMPEILRRFASFSYGCWNLQLRMALYQAADQNFVVNGGPASICYFSNVNYMMFKIITPTAPQATENSMSQRNLTLNETPAFARPGQKWIWADDDSEVILRAFRDNQNARC